MECPICSHRNPADARFCENCGSPLEATCPNCGRAVSPQARFCRHCGHNLADAGALPGATARPSSGLAAIRSAAPASLTRKVLADRSRIEGERKRVTALFVDIVGSTSLAEAMDPEDWRDVVTGAHERVSAEVYRLEGTIAQLLGDGVLAFFGAPLTHEDDPERAIRSSLAILDSVRRYREELVAAARVPDFQVRIGINTGLVVVGTIGDDLHMEYLAVGDTINLAARVQSAADPDTILVTGDTHRLVSTLFDFEDRGEISVKGKAEPIHIYRVLGARKGAVRPRGIAGVDSPMVGRRREFSTLVQILDDVRQGQGATVAIVGEAGLGKSRLVAEWRRHAPAEASPPLRWVEARCLSFGAAMAHHLSTEILRGLIGAGPEATPEQLSAALDRTLEKAFGEPTDEVRPYLAHLLGLELEGDAAARVKYLDGPALQARYVSAYAELLRHMCQQTPTVIVCEDVHWSDPSSVDLGAKLLPVVGEVPLVVALVLRPERDSPGWRLLEAARETAGGGAIEIHLAPLSEADTEHLVENLLDVQDLPEEIRTLIQMKAEGNPFFVEEVLRMLIDQGVLERDEEVWRLSSDAGQLRIPDTLQGVLASRIDRLPEDAKRVLQIASVIGRTFQVRILEDVVEHQSPAGRS